MTVSAGTLRPMADRSSWAILASRIEVWNLLKWGQERDKMTGQRKRGYSVLTVTPRLDLVSPVGIEPTTY
jgi:hypothetical protein